MTQEITNIIAQQSYIETELKKFSITDEAIHQLKTKYSSLAINGNEDKQGYLVVKEARLDIKSKRVDVEKKRKELTTDALKFQKAINAEASRITELLEPIESHLKAQEDAYEAEKERIKQEKEQEQQAKLHGRINILLGLGFKFVNGNYISIPEIAFTTNINAACLKLMADAEFDDLVSKARDAYEQYQTILAETELLREKEFQRAEQLRKEEAERLAVERKAQEEERIRLEAIAREQAKKEEMLKAEVEKLEVKRIETISKETDNVLQSVAPDALYSYKETGDRREKQTIDNVKELYSEKFDIVPSVYLCGKSILISHDHDEIDKAWFEAKIKKENPNI